MKFSPFFQFSGQLVQRHLDNWEKQNLYRLKIGED